MLTEIGQLLDEMLQFEFTMITFLEKQKDSSLCKLIRSTTVYDITLLEYIWSC